MPNRSVKVAFTVETVMRIPSDWDEEDGWIDPSADLPPLSDAEIDEIEAVYRQIRR